MMENERMDAIQVAYGKAVAKAWSDADYKSRLLDNPRAALSEIGLDLPGDARISVVEDSADRRHFVLPAPPAEGEVSEEVLQQASGGLCCCWFCSW